MSAAQIISIYVKPKEETLLNLLTEHLYPKDHRKRGTVIMEAIKRLALLTREPALVAAVAALKEPITKTKITD